MIERTIMGAALLALATGAAPVPTGSELDLTFTNLRSAKGSLLVCITADPAYFPDCTEDPDKRFLTVPASKPILIVSGLAQARYAVSVHHDENGNDKLDTFAGIPKEGIGFSRNPKITFGPPGFDKVALAIGPGVTTQTVRMRYFL
ncbi:DUF2141 domain-containing protein [Novosphingopyxis sp.]|uniref:DUF2141 domain-containing protein n=1 Tax=Novosphingopyxis sp. TaxID=2709690 RepID=UPI003B5A3CC8